MSPRGPVFNLATMCRDCPAAAHHLCMAGGPGLEPVWRSGLGDPDYTASARKRVVYTASGPNSVVRGREAAPGLCGVGPKSCRLHVFGPKPRSPDLLVPISTPAPDLAPGHTQGIPPNTPWLFARIINWLQPKPKPMMISGRSPGTPRGRQGGHL